MMYVRFLGDKICWTILSTGAFYIGDITEASPEELRLCEAGGGEMPTTAVIKAVAV